MMNYLLIAIAGAFGAVARYGLSGLTHRMLGWGFPYGTFVVNILGCFVMGFIMKASLTTTLIPETWRIVITIGFLGALTTFSTFSYETIKLLEDGSYALALTNIAANVILGIAATIAGAIISKLILGG
jgi:CrcB protein